MKNTPITATVSQQKFIEGVVSEADRLVSRIAFTEGWLQAIRDRLAGAAEGTPEGPADPLPEGTLYRLNELVYRAHSGMDALFRRLDEIESLA